jgi:KaiC/GvpD/RAD55 family RecA-like ATPase
MAFKNLDNERDNLLNFVNNADTAISDLETDVGALEIAVYNIQAAIADALESEEETTPTVEEFDGLVSVVNDILSALRAYGVIEETPEV